jgi:ferric-dicitrate binding protein FerR (iron transport regulator)
MLFWKSSLMIKKDKIWDLTSQYKEDYEPNHHKGWADMQRKMASESDSTAKVVQMSGARKWLRVAAILALFVGGAFIFQTILGDNLETLATNDGKIQEIELSDGTKVWVNGNSELRYPETFEDGERVVYLKGEAFFDVAKHTNKPFRIEMEASHVEVLGTSFNVRSHEGEDFVEVQVETGKVMFAADKNEPMALTAMDKVTFDKKVAKCKQSRDENSNACAWKRNELRFNKTPLNEVFDLMERFYKIDLNIENTDVSNCDDPFSTRLNKASLQKAITALSAIYDIEFVEQSNGKYLVKGGVCPQ